MKKVCASNVLQAYLFAILLCSLWNYVQGLEAEGIIGGLPVKPGEIKYIVSVQVSGPHENKFHPLCTGGIIGNRYILTAAHCFFNSLTNKFENNKYKIVAAKINLKVDDPLSIEIPVKKIFIPKKYNDLDWNSAVPEADIAVLKLEVPLDLEHNPNLEKLHLPAVKSSDHHNNTSYEKTFAIFAGYGWNTISVISSEKNETRVKGRSTYRLHQAKTVISDQPSCLYYYINVRKSHLCAKVINYNNDRPQGSCKGDSGGPLVSRNSTIIGVLSATSNECNDNKKPSLYTRVTSYVKFIKNIKKNITDDSRVYIANSNGVLF